MSIEQCADIVPTLWCSERAGATFEIGMMIAATADEWQHCDIFPAWHVQSCP